MTATVQPEAGVASAPWNLGDLLSFDTETTGVNVDADRIVSAALVGRDGVPRNWLIAVDIDIPAGAEKVHGISTAHAREHGRPAVEVIEEIAAAVAEVFAQLAVLIVVNAPFDLTLLDRECARHGLPTVAERLGREVGPVVDPMCLDRAADKYRRGGRTLTDLCRHYEVEFTDAHTADADAKAGLALALAVAEKFPQLQVPGALVHSWQIGWYRQWAEGLQEFKRRRDPSVVIPPFWPLAPLDGGS